MGAVAIVNLYQTLKSKHLTVNIDSEAVVKHFSFFNQNKQAENFQAINRDIAAFFEIISVDWDTRNKVRNDYGQQERGILVFNMHYYRKSLKADETATLELLDYTNELHRAINMIGGDNFDNTTRVSDVQDTSHENVTGWIITYRTQIFEQSTDLNRTVVNPDLVVNKEVIV